MLHPSDDIDARVALAVAGRAHGMHIVNRETAGAHTLTDELRARPIPVARRIHRGKTNQLASQFDEFIAPRVDGLE